MQSIAIFPVAMVLVQRSARAHLNGPLDLCPADLGVDGPADVVDGEIIEDLGSFLDPSIDGHIVAQQ